MTRYNVEVRITNCDNGSVFTANTDGLGEPLLDMIPTGNPAKPLGYAVFGQASEDSFTAVFTFPGSNGVTWKEVTHE